MKEYKIYCCGITPNKNGHLGHLRTILTAILVKKCLSAKLQKTRVSLAVNWTDIDTKILSLSPSLSITELAEIQFQRVRNQLGIFLNFEDIDFEPRVSQHIFEIVKDIISIRKYLSFKKDGIYIKDSHHRLLTVNTEGDFAVWKENPRGSKTPLGKGLPGWHIECASMILKRFKGSCDLHLGGRDLLFPHHVNEDCLFHYMTGSGVSKKWMHSGLINIEGKKMSKSSGKTINLGSCCPVIYKIYLTFFSYKVDINYSDRSLQEVLKFFQGSFSKIDFLHLPKLRDIDFNRFHEQGFSWALYLKFFPGNVDFLASLLTEINVIPLVKEGVLLTRFLELYDFLREGKFYELSDFLRNFIEGKNVFFSVTTVQRRSTLRFKIPSCKLPL